MISVMMSFFVLGLRLFQPVNAAINAIDTLVQHFHIVHCGGLTAFQDGYRLLFNLDGLWFPLGL